MKKITNEAVFLGARTFLLPNHITHLEADINYTNVYTSSGRRKVLSTTLHKVHDCLNRNGNFIRISRKHVVNMDFVEDKSINGLVLGDGTELQFSRRMGKKFINKHLSPKSYDSKQL
jgi:two-component system LytT family response regulator